MSFIASMVSAAAISAGASAVVGGIAGAAATGAVGAGLGAGIGAATGGDAGEGALMGGIGGLGAGAGAILGGATMGAEAIGEGAALSGGAEGAAAGGAPLVENAGLQSSGVVTQGLGTQTAPITGEVTSGSLVSPTVAGNSVVSPAVNPALTSAANPAPVVQGPVQASQGALDPGVFAAKNVAANEANASWGSQLLSKAGIADAGQTGNAIGGKALENAVYGAGINGLLAGAQGKDVGKGMLTGAVSGGVGGAAAGGLGQMGGTVGEFATNNPGITSTLVGGATNMALDNALTSNPTMPEQKGIRSNYKWNPNVYKPYGPQFAAGGITDLDNYDQTPQMQSPGTLDIPNRNEVSNNQGYMGDSVQLMAKGGLAYGGGGLLGSPMLDMGIISALPQGALSFLPESGIARDAYGMTAGKYLSPDLADHLYKSQDDVNKDEKDAKTKEEKIKAALYKQKVMQQLAQQGQVQGMAHGGISDLGSYSDGGRLLKGPGDGVSDSINATIGGKQPARLATGEFVLPARIVSELGNGSTDAGAKRLYQMMDRIQSDRKKTTGKGKFSDNPKAYKHLPA
jgi:hypothetical protein